MRIAFALMAVAFFGCKTQKNLKKDDSSTSTSSSVSGTFDQNNQVVIPAPQEIKGLSLNNLVGDPNVQSTASSVNALGLTGAPPVSSRGIEEIIYKCFSHDSDFVAEGWFFYAKILSNGESIKDIDSQKVDRCDQMQLTLSNLDVNRTYQIYAEFYWKSADGKTTIVYYDGQTSNFKPSDQNRTLTLRKRITSQKVNVELEKSEKDKCIARDYLWNGYACLDSFFGVSFVNADYTDLADPTAPRSRKCLTVGAQGSAFIQECRYNISQNVRPQLMNVERIPVEFKPMDGELGWFSLYFDTGTDGRPPFCLTARKTTGNQYVVLQEACQDPKLPPRASQLWNLIPLGTGDMGSGRDSFKLVSQAFGQTLCLSSPPEARSIAKGPAIRDGAPIRLTPCTGVNENILISQPIQFHKAGD